MSGTVEASRRHGAFDPRRLKRLRLVGAPDRVAPAVTGLKDVPTGLDWYAFLSHSFPGTRRHDLEAINAYSAYQHGRGVAEEHPPGAQTPGADQPPVLLVLEASSDSPTSTPRKSATSKPHPQPTALLKPELSRVLGPVATG
ncbi:MAG TPA: hypothetical protein VKB10_10990 [Gaiellaceae bacterium]|nr:hypothetical protein [Gaiellaceae bacterium]